MTLEDLEKLVVLGEFDKCASMMIWGVKEGRKYTVALFEENMDELEQKMAKYEF